MNIRVTAALLLALALSPLAHGSGKAPSQSGLKGAAIADHSDRAALRILFFGDSGTGSEAQFNVGLVMNQICVHRGCDLALQLGDNIYEDGVKDVNDRKFRTHFELPYEGFSRFDFWTIAGNHDWRGNVAAEIEYTAKSPRWRMPGYHYSVPKLPEWVRIYAFDTEKLTQAQVDAARPHLCDRAAKWKIAIGHHPIHSNGRHGDSKSTAELLLPLFRQCGVQLYLSGHDHHQEHITGRNFEQIVSGAGAKLRDVKTVPYKEGDPKRQNFARSELGFGIAYLEPERLTVDFYDEHGREIYEWSTTPESYGLGPGIRHRATVVGQPSL